MSPVEWKLHFSNLVVLKCPGVVLTMEHHGGRLVIVICGLFSRHSNSQYIIYIYICIKREALSMHYLCLEIVALN